MFRTVILKFPLNVSKVQKAVKEALWLDRFLFPHTAQTIIFFIRTGKAEIWKKKVSTYTFKNSHEWISWSASFQTHSWCFCSGGWVRDRRWRSWSRETSSKVRWLLPLIQSSIFCVCPPWTFDREKKCKDRVNECFKAVESVLRGFSWFWTLLPWLCNFIL